MSINVSKYYSRSIINNVKLQAATMSRLGNTDMRYDYETGTSVCLRKVGKTDFFNQGTNTEFVIVESDDSGLVISNGLYEARVTLH